MSLCFCTTDCDHIENCELCSRYGTEICFWCAYGFYVSSSSECAG